MKTYSLSLHWKQGDDLNACLDNTKTVSEAFEKWGEHFEECRKICEIVSDVIKGRKIEVEADTHSITLTANDNEAKKALELLKKDEILGVEEFDEDVNEIDYQKDGDIVDEADDLTVWLDVERISPKRIDIEKFEKIISVLGRDPEITNGRHMGWTFDSIKEAYKAFDLVKVLDVDDVEISLRYDNGLSDLIKEQINNSKREK